MKILIIEDDQSVAELERDYLEINGGFQCDLHTDGTQGLQAALTEDYALVIVDVMLPGLSGFEICRRLREKLGFGRYFKKAVMNGCIQNVEYIGKADNNSAQYKKKGE